MCRSKRVVVVQTGDGRMTIRCANQQGTLGAAQDGADQLLDWLSELMVVHTRKDVAGLVGLSLILIFVPSRPFYILYAFLSLKKK